MIVVGAEQQIYCTNCTIMSSFKITKFEPSSRVKWCGSSSESYIGFGFNNVGKVIKIYRYSILLLTPSKIMRLLAVPAPQQQSGQQLLIFMFLIWVTYTCEDFWAGSHSWERPPVGGTDTRRRKRRGSGAQSAPAAEGSGLGKRRAAAEWPPWERWLRQNRRWPPPHRGCCRWCSQGCSQAAAEKSGPGATETPLLVL
jgi:hypothetical protein